MDWKKVFEKKTSREDLVDTKVFIPTVEENERVQRILFSLGYSWSLTRGNVEFNRYADEGRLYLFLGTTTLSFDTSREYFDDHRNREIQSIDIR